MATVLKQNWDGKLTGKYNRASSGADNSLYNRAVDPQKNFTVSSAGIITKLSVKTHSSNQNPKIIFLATIEDSKIIFASGHLAVTTVEGEAAIYEVATNIPITPAMGAFVVGFTTTNGMLLGFNNYAGDDGNEYKTYYSGHGISAQVGETINLVEDDAFIGVKVEIDGDSTGQDPDELNLHIALDVNETVDLTGYIHPIAPNVPQLVWSSENAAIASVDQNGKVTGNAVGITKVHVKTPDNSWSAFARIIVEAEGTSDLRLSILLEPGETARLKGLFQPSGTDKPVVWSSSNPAVATVTSNGKVTAVAVGESIITVQTVDGSLSDYIYVTAIADKT